MNVIWVSVIISFLVAIPFPYNSQKSSYSPQTSGDSHTFSVSGSQDGYEEEFKGNYIMRQWLEGCEEDKLNFNTPSSSVFPVQEPYGYEIECQGNLILKAWLGDEE